MSMRVMPFVLAALLGVAAAGLVACGSGGGDRSDLIPQRSADRLKAALSDARSAVDDGDCDQAQQALVRARSIVVNLPSAVSDRLVARLQEGLDNLAEVAPRECEQSTQTQTQETTTTAPETTPQETTSTEKTTDTTPTNTDTTPTTTTAPQGTTTTPPPADTTTTPADPSGGATTP
jgi:hypothetical protein